MAVASGCAVALAGYGGDDWFDTASWELSDLLRRGRVIASIGWLAEDGNGSGSPSASMDPSHGRSWMALPETARHAARRVLGRNPVPWWIEPGFARARQPRRSPPLQAG